MRQNESYGRRLWRLWGAMVIHLLISYACYMIYSCIYSFTCLQSMDGSEAANVIANGAESSAVYDQVMQAMALNTTAIETVAALLTLPIIYFMMYRKDRMNEKAENRAFITNGSVVNYAKVILMSLGMAVVLNNFIIIGNLSSYSDSYESTVESLYAVPLWMQVIGLVVVMPLCEELIFRGIMFKRMRERSGFVSAAMYSAIVFGITHGNMVQMVYAFFMGLTFAFVYEKVGTFKAAYMAHIFANLFSVIATYTGAYDWFCAAFLRIAILTVGCAAAATAAYASLRNLPSGEMIPVIDEE